MFNIHFLKKESLPSVDALQIQGRDIKIVVCLGNPVEGYEASYHNAGFLFLDFLTSLYPNNGVGKSQNFKNIKSFAYARLGGLVFAKPTTLMNNSGKAVKELLRYFDASPSELLVVHDDSDIPFGEYKFSFGRGSAGHNGAESIIKYIGTVEFLRLRIGVRNTNQKAGDFVLSKIPKDKLGDLENLFAEIKTSHFKV